MEIGQVKKEDLKFLSALRLQSTKNIDASE